MNEICKVVLPKPPSNPACRWWWAPGIRFHTILFCLPLDTMCNGLSESPSAHGHTHVHTNAEVKKEYMCACPFLTFSHVPFFFVFVS